MRKRKLLWLLAAVCAVVSGCVVWWVGSWANRLSKYGPVARTLPAEIEAAHREGLPLTPADLRVGTDIPDQQNAATFYRRIHDILGKQSKEQRDAEGTLVADFISSDGREGSKDKITAILHRQQEVIGEAERAARLLRCEYHRPFEQGEEMLFPEYAEARHLARLFAARALLQSEAGDLLAALNSIRIGAVVGRHVAQDRLLIGMLVSIAVARIMDRAFTNVLRRHRDDPRLLGLAKEANGAFAPVPDIKRYFEGELVLGRASIERMRQGPATPSMFQRAGLTSGETSNSVKLTIYDAWDARLIHTWRDVFAILRAHDGDREGAYQGLKELDDKELLHAKEPTYELNEELLPVNSHAVTPLFVMTTLATIRETAIRLLEFRQAHGAFPNGLSEVKGEAPIDFYSGKPLVYRTEGKGFLLYSIGEDRKDDGGQSVKDPKTKKPLDIVIKL